MEGRVDEGAIVGEGTRVWMNAHVMKGAVIGRECNIGEGVFVEGGARIGDRVTIKNGVQVWDGIVLEDDVFVGPNATFCNDKFPRSKHHLESYAVTTVERGSSLGANCTILPGIRIGTLAMVGAGSVVTHDVSPKTVVAGNPARHLKFVDAEVSPASDAVATFSSKVKGVSLLQFPAFRDRRGVLSFAEYETHIPWVPKRFFTISAVPLKEVRGYHAHQFVKQLLVCVSGRVEVLVDDGTNRQSITLNNPRVGLMLDPLVWSSQSYVQPASVLLVLCSEKHNPSGYIHSYSEFQAVVKARATEPVKVPFLNVRAAAELDEAGIRNAFERVLQSGQYVGGPEVEGFEQEWASFCHGSYCVGFVKFVAI